MAENIDHDFVVQLTGIIGGVLAFIKFMDYQFKEKVKKSTKTNMNTSDIDHLEEELRMLSKELSNTKSDIFEKMNKHEEFAEEWKRQVKVDIITLIRDLASLEGQFKTYKEMDKHHK